VVVSSGVTPVATGQNQVLSVQNGSPATANETRVMQ